MSEPVKRRPGRPKGSKNKPGANNVGRPRKDGRPPQKRTFHPADELNISADNSRNDTTSIAGPSNSRHPRVNIVSNTSTSSPQASSSINNGKNITLMSYNTAETTAPRANQQNGDLSSWSGFAPFIRSDASPHSAVATLTTGDSSDRNTPPRPQLTSSEPRSPGDRANVQPSRPLEVSSQLPVQPSPTPAQPSQPPSQPSQPLAQPSQPPTQPSQSLEEPSQSPARAPPPDIPVSIPAGASPSGNPASTPRPVSQHDNPGSPRVARLPTLPRPPLLTTLVSRPKTSANMHESLSSVRLPDFTEIIDNPYGSDISAARGQQANEDGEDEDWGELGEDEDLDQEFGRDDDSEDEGEDDMQSLGEAASRRSAGGTDPTPESVNGSTDSPKKPVPRSTMPTWLQAEFTLIREKLQSEIKASPRKMPSCYEQGTFYVGGANPFLQFASGVAPILDSGLFYQPEFYVWLPHIFVKKIPCPNCHATGSQGEGGAPVFLRKKGWTQKPRRAVDIEKNVYIIGYRYLCGTCKRNYRSWNPALLNILPASVSSQFPFQLTYRSGLTHQLVSILRESFRNGVGPVPFTQMIQAFHYRRYDELREQYLEMVHYSVNNGNLTMFMNSGNQSRQIFTPFSAFRDRSGYAGFVPSANYFVRFYDSLVEKSAPEMRQLIAMTSARVLEADHSFKWAKRTARIKGEPVFSAINTTVNEYGEIRAATLTATKAHSQFMPVLAAIPDSLRLFGHGATEVVFTDNVRADKSALELAFPSLLDGVTSAAAQQVLEPLVLPETWSFAILTHLHQINNRLNVIMANHSSQNPVLVGFDMEWPVDIQTGLHGRVATIQISHQNVIYIIQTHNLIRDGFLELPNALLAFLRSSLYKKVGVNIGADFKRLFKDAGLKENDTPFTGQIELGALARDRGAASRRNVSLAELCSTVLRRSITKEPTIRVSTHWADAVLPNDFVQYAVLDVFAVSEVYTTLMATTAPTENVTLDTPGGTPITMFSSDKKEVARGILALDRPSKFDGVNVSSTRVVATILEVLVPAYLISGSLLPSKEATPLSAFGSPPFTILVDRRNLRTRPASVQALTSTDESDSGMPSDITLAASESPFELSDILRVSQCQAADALWDPDMCDTVPDSMNSLRSSESEVEQNIMESGHDQAAEAAATIILSQFQDLPATTLRIFSRVLGDIFHLHNEFPISLHHGLRRPFARALSTAIFIPDPADKAAVEAVFQKTGTSYNSQLLSRPKWVLRRVKRYVPPPDILLPRVSLVIKTFGPLKDSKTGAPLFNDAAWEVAKNVLENIRRGFYSDPPGVKLYYDMGQDKYGLRVYRCCRGTNSVEGGVHQNLIRRFTSFNVGPRHAVNSLLDYVTCHNIQVGTYNRTGRGYAGHFDVSLKNRVTRLLDVTAHAFVDNNQSSRGEWVNGNDYAQAGEVFGIMPFDAETLRKFSMKPYNRDVTKRENLHHSYLSEKQGTLFAVLPIHTKPERDLYQLMIGISPHFTGKAQPDWAQLTSQWSLHCDGKVIFYKLPEHLKAYFKTWNDFRNEQNSLSVHIEAYRQVRALLKAPSNSVPPIPVAMPALLQASLAESGSLVVADDVSPHVWQIRFTQVLAEHRALMQFCYSPRPNPTHVNAPQAPDGPSRKGKRRADEQAPEDRENALKRKKIKAPKPRTCRHCGQEDCQGKWGVEKCSKYQKYQVEHAIAVRSSGGMNNS